MQATPCTPWHQRAKCNHPCKFSSYPYMTFPQGDNAPSSALCRDYLWCGLGVCPWRWDVARVGEGGGGGWLGWGPPSGCCWCYLFSITTGLNSPTALSVLPPNAAVPSRPMYSCRPEAVKKKKTISKEGQYFDNKAPF